MRGNQYETCKLEENKQHESKSQNTNPCHLHIIKLIKDAKHTALTSVPPDLSQILLLRTRAMAIYPSKNPITYIVKQSGELLVDEGQYDSLDKNPAVLKLGVNPLTHMPMYPSSRERFKEELSNASYAFFQRSAMKQLKESTSVNNGLKTDSELAHAFKQ